MAPQASDPLDLPPWASVRRKVHPLLLTGLGGQQPLNFIYTHVTEEKAEADKLSDPVLVLGPGTWQNQSFRSVPPWLGRPGEPAGRARSGGWARTPHCLPRHPHRGAQACPSMASKPRTP